MAGNEPQAVRLNYNHHYCQLYCHHCLYSYDCSHQNQFKVLAMIIHIVTIAIISNDYFQPIFVIAIFDFVINYKKMTPPLCCNTLQANF